MVLYFRNGTAGTLFGNSNTASLYFGKGTNTTYFPRSPYTYFGGGGGSGPVYDPDAVILFAAMTVQPDTARKEVINQLILNLKAAGIWSVLDVLYVTAAHDAQAAGLNWKAPASFVLTAVNSPTFTTDRGYAGDGTTSYLDTGWAPNNGVQFTQNSAHFGLWLRSVGAAAGNILGRATAGTPILFTPNPFGSGVQLRLNSGAAVYINPPAAAGWNVCDRASSTTIALRKDGVEQGTAAQTSSARDSAALLIGRAGSSFSTAQVAAASFGASIASLDSSYYAALQTYMTAVGA